jgi:hypothetical protein
MIIAHPLKAVVFAGIVALSPVGPALGQDASFPCKVLLCGQANWPAIRYCVPIMQQATWMGLLGIAVGACAEALQGAQNHQNNSGGVQNPASGLAGPNTNGGFENPATCPLGAVPVSESIGGHIINASGSLCGTPTSSQVQSDIAAQCGGFTDGTCATVWTAGTLTITNPASAIGSAGGTASK